MKRPRLRARTRLTLWYVGLLAGTLLLLGWLAGWAVERSLYASLDEVLRTQSAGVQPALEVERGQLQVETDHLPPSGGLDLLQIYDAGGRLVYGAGQAEPLSDAASRLAPILGGQTAAWSERLPSGEQVRLYAEPAQERGRVVGVVLVGRSEAEIARVLGQLWLVGLSGSLLAVGLAWSAGSFLAARALAPVDRITRAAEQIGAEDLSRRLALGLPDDELGRLAGAFDGMIERLDRAFERQRRFTADASHELRTPLAIIRSQVDVALSQPRQPSYYVEVLTSIREESERLTRLAESLLVLARADTGRPLELGPLDLTELVAECGARTAAAARERGIRFEVAAAEVGPVLGDPAWLTQLALNLLDNALRHTPAGGAVRLALEPAVDGARLTVTDTGEGIAAEHLPHLFERFYRAERGRARTAGGVGLGLAICDWVTRAHGGRLEVESRLGQGSRFSLWLPAAPSAAPTNAPRPAPQGDRLIDRADAAPEQAPRQAGVE